MSNSKYKEVLADAFADELMKIAELKGKLSPETMKRIGLVGAGAIGYGTLSQANQDRRLGRTMRMQQQGF